MDNYLQTKGRIFDIQRYSIHDGTGIRTIVFLKGCHLRCRWCCNPESQEYEIQNMTIGGKDKIVGEDVTVEEVMKTVMKDLPYYKRTNGGLTLSGGEFLNQPEFALALLRAAKANGITTAVETTSNADFKVIEKMLPYIDQYLMDIKHMDSNKHEKFTQSKNELLIENAMKISKSGLTELSIRVPVVPGFNDTPEEIRAIARYTKTLPNVKRMHLLPYHNFGYDKYIGLGRDYPMGSVPSPSNEKMNELLEIAKQESLVECQIGG
ncbi:MAG TPA: glycyl-radical enzyme activating protein [Candidatus Dorea intestinavium]|nr:glycyl-radical enzyme activating protein [Candidatus Dorea intestinavium]